MSLVKATTSFETESYNFIYVIYIYTYLFYQKRYTLSTQVVNFTNILQTAFVPISLHQKMTNPNCKHIKSAKKHSKMLVKFTLA